MSDSLPSPRHFLLELLFDATTMASKDTLETSLKASITAAVDLNVNATPRTPTDNAWFVTLRGPLEAVDQAHENIDKLARKAKWRFVRLTDEASEEIRLQAYPIFARIESRLRIFINEKAIAVLGFGWLRRFAPPSVRDKAVEYAHNNAAALESLETTLLDHLPEIITAEVSDWTPDKQFSLEEVRALLGAGSIEAADQIVREKTTPVSFWDIFSPFFEDPLAWHDLAKELKALVWERNNVMHHRAVKLSLLRRLNEFEVKLETLLTASKSEIAVEERQHVRVKAEEILPFYERAVDIWQDHQKAQQRALQNIALELRQAVEVRQKIAQDWERIVSQAQLETTALLLERLQEQVRPVLESYNRDRGYWSAQLKAIRAESLRQSEAEIEKLSQTAREARRMLSVTQPTVQIPNFKEIVRNMEVVSAYQDRFLPNAQQMEEIRRICADIERRKRYGGR